MILFIEHFKNGKVLEDRLVVSRNWGQEHQRQKEGCVYKITVGKVLVALELFSILTMEVEAGIYTGDIMVQNLMQTYTHTEV